MLQNYKLSVRSVSVLILIASLLITTGFWIRDVGTDSSADTSSDSSQVLGIGSGTGYYVDATNGVDTNNGTSPATAWKTFTKVNSITLQPGDVVYLKRGESWNGMLEINANENGTASDPIAIRPYGTGNRPTITNNTMVTSGDTESRYRGIFVKGDHVLIEDVHITGVRYSAIESYIGGDYVTVQNVEIDNSGVGFRISGSFNRISGSYIHDMTMVVNDPAPFTDYGALATSIEGDKGLVDGTIIEHNVFKNCRADSMDYVVDGDGGAVEFFGDISNTIVRYNYAEGNKGFIEVGGPQTIVAPIEPRTTNTNTLVHHNVMKNNNGILVLFNGGSNIYKAHVVNFKVENNTWFEEINGSRSIIYFQGDTAIASQFTLRNNLLYVGALPIGEGMEAYMTRQTNIYSKWASKQQNAGFTLVNGELYRSLAQLGFTDPAQGNFAITSSSAAVNVATNLGYTKDYSDVAIPQSSGPDIGAYEYAEENSLLANVEVTESGGSTAVSEAGTTDQVQIKLKRAPSQNVTINFTSSDQVSTAPTSLVFTTSNWATNQSITVSAVNDAVIEGNHSGNIGMVTASSDPNYADKVGPIISVAITDNDTAGLVVTETGGSTNVTEGGAGDDIYVVLSTIPSANVTITISFGSNIIAAPTTLTFTPANWSTGQQIAISPVDNAVLDGSRTDAVSFASSSSDANYQGITQANIVVNVADNEVPPTSTCTDFTYSAWSTCTNGTRTRTVTGTTPSVCTGGSPVTSESCVSTCTSFTYSDWGSCTNGVRTRTVNSSLPASCAGGSPITQEACATVSQAIVCGPIDINSDTKITFADFGAFVRAYGKTCSDTAAIPACGKKDANGDGKVNFADFESFIQRYNKASCSIN